MRWVIGSVAVLILWSAAAQAAGAGDSTHAGAPPPQLRLRGAEPSVAVVGTQSGSAPARANNTRGALVVGTPQQPSPQTHSASAYSQSTSAPSAPNPTDRPAVSDYERPDTPDVSIGDASATAEFALAPQTVPAGGAANIDILGGRTNNAADPAASGPLRLGVFSEFASRSYVPLRRSGGFVLRDVASHAVQPLIKAKKNRPLPITEISIAVMAVLSFILVRRLVASIRRRRTSSTPLS